MKKYFPILKHVNIANITTSVSLVVSVSSLLLVLQHHLKLGLTVYALTFILDKLYNNIKWLPRDVESGLRLLKEELTD